MNKLPIMKAFETTFSVVFGNLLEIIRIVWLPLALMTVALWWILLNLFIAFYGLSVSMNEGEDPDPEQVLATMQPMFGWIALLLLVTLIFVPMLRAGLLRFVLRGERATGLFYFRYGRDELRILLTGIIWYLIYLGLVFVAEMACIALIFFTNAQFPELAPLVGGIAIMGALVFVIWILLRLSLAWPGAIATKGIGIGPSWHATKGNTLRLLVYWLLWCGLFLLVWGVCEFALIWLILPLFATELPQLTAEGGPEQSSVVLKAVLDYFAAVFDYHNPAVIAGALIGFLFAIVLCALNICAGGVAYKLLTSQDASDKETESAA